jgi:hypothetical protein
MAKKGAKPATMLLSQRDLDMLPTEKEQIALLSLEFRRLADDSPAGCPYPLTSVRRYITAETGRKGHELFFGRTALVGRVRFWLWGIMDEGTSLYVDASEFRGASLLSMGSGEGLTPEQYIGLAYARYWRIQDRPPSTSGR